MNRNLTIAAIAMVAVIMGMSAFAPAMADKPGTEPNEGKVLICHIPPGNPENARTISVSDDVETIEDHLAHGDFLGSCED
jgi:hypothetical protein